MKKRLIISAILISLLISGISYAAEKRFLSKKQVIDLALRQNQKLDKLRQDIKIAQAKLGGAKSAFYPNIGLNSSYTRFKEKQRLTMSKNKNSFAVGLNLQQPIFLGGQLWSTYQQMQNNLKVAKLKLQEEKKKIKYQVLEQYYNILKVKKMIEVTKQQLKRIKQYLEVAKVNLEVGIATKTDVLQAKVNYNQAQQRLLQVKNRLQLAKLALQNSLGISSQVKLKFNKELNWQPVDIVDNPYQYALKNRIQFDILKLQAKNLKLNLQRVRNKDKYPNLNLMINYQARDKEFTVKDGSLQLTLNLQYNLFDGGKDEAKIKEMTKSIDKFRISQQQIEDQIRLQVKQTILNLKEARQRIKLNKLNLQKAKENLEHTKLKFKEGMITSLEMLGAETTLKQVKTDYYQAIYDYNLAQAKLNMVLGKEEINND
ncbi:outer membrane protein [Halobacteroides halobius DSM 5150]|uniref:Outer membrane protein n=1 Tax=Halobacteroides halobius (strain ATCC 35273 / DSM 5150 / MD-1) TaxID=748449 RepID=L0K921_HALHC|nr:TolC family protein [Halobacteroides halobius]AGB41516.1 outer membrane protein [Halobacteroides halobius DSM 5150]